VIHAGAPGGEDPSSRSAVQGERKQVTVLPCRREGLMELAGQVETETW
jgi:hypothetical protein